MCNFMANMAFLEKINIDETIAPTWKNAKVITIRILHAFPEWERYGSKRPHNQRYFSKDGTIKDAYYYNFFSLQFKAKYNQIEKKYPIYACDCIPWEIRQAFAEDNEEIYENNEKYIIIKKRKKYKLLNKIKSLIGKKVIKISGNQNGALFLSKKKSKQLFI